MSADTGMAGVRVRRLHVVANPAAGKDTAVLAELNRALGGRVDWDVSVTQASGDAERFARLAVEQGADAVAAYGGDGTVKEVAAALAGGSVPLVVLPGGTANVMAHELGIPAALSEAASLVLGGNRVRRIDMAETSAGERFFLRAGVGWEAETVQGAQRDLKDQLGELAYVLSGIRELLRTEQARYRLEVDGEHFELDAVSCVLANSVALGLGDVVLHPAVAIDDGALDLLVLRRGDPQSLLAWASASVKREAADEAVAHFQGKSIRIECDPPQNVVLDGEEAGTTPLEAHVLPAAVPVLVPAAGRETESDDKAAQAAEGR